MLLALILTQNAFHNFNNIIYYSMNNIKVSIDDLFYQEPKPPFSVNLNLNPPDNCKFDDIFDRIKQIYMKGLVILTGGNTESKQITLDIKKVTQKHIDTMEKHMLSFGLKTTFLIMNEENKDSMFKYLLYELQESIPELNFSVTIDWRKQLIKKIDFHIPLQNKENIIKEMEKIASKHNVANIFLKMKKPSKLKEYSILIKNVKESYIVYFDFANIADYQKIYKCIRVSC